MTASESAKNKMKGCSYPFIVTGDRSRLVNVVAKGYTQALNKVLSLNPGKYIKTKFAKFMDLHNAQEEARKKSTQSAHKQHVVLKEKGNFEVENDITIEPNMDVYATYHKGKKLDAPVIPNRVLEQAEKIKQKEIETAQKQREAVEKSLRKEVKQLNKNKMKTAKKVEAPAKKVVTKVEAAPAKKVAKKVEAVKKSAPVKKIATPSGAKISGAKTVSISTEDMLKKIKKGYKYYTPQGQRKGETTLEAREDKKKLHEMQEVAAD